MYVFFSSVFVLFVCTIFALNEFSLLLSFGYSSLTPISTFIVSGLCLWDLFYVYNIFLCISRYRLFAFVFAKYNAILSDESLSFFSFFLFCFFLINRLYSNWTGHIFLRLFLLFKFICTFYNNFLMQSIHTTWRCLDIIITDFRFKIHSFLCANLFFSKHIWKRYFCLSSTAVISLLLCINYFMNSYDVFEFMFGNWFDSSQFQPKISECLNISSQFCAQVHLFASIDRTYMCGIWIYWFVSFCRKLESFLKPIIAHIHVKNTKNTKIADAQIQHHILSQPQLLVILFPMIMKFQNYRNLKEFMK